MSSSNCPHPPQSERAVFVVRLPRRAPVRAERLVAGRHVEEELAGIGAAPPAGQPAAFRQ